MASQQKTYSSTTVVTDSLWIPSVSYTALVTEQKRPTAGMDSFVLCPLPTQR